jgi:GH15 family glucan-1,4-alpha-glucosidase
MRGSALVADDGSIDWLCVPRFDSDACFAALLGTPEHGRWRIAPRAALRRTSRAYRDGSMVLETLFECDGGSVRIIDFMPLDPERHEVVRIVEGVDGRAPMELELAARFGYGLDRPFIRGSSRELDLIAGADALTLFSPVPCTVEDAKVHARFDVVAGQRLAFTLAWRPSHRPVVGPLSAEHALVHTDDAWRAWAARCTYRGPWRDAVVRSIVTLKALTYAPTSGIVAAPTTSLPEQLGGERNWDYRYCWLRDASLTLYALLHTGYVEEATAWRDWLVRAVLGDPMRLRIMYGIAGERRLTEMELPWLPGYEGSRPVRIGNAASDQFQLDVYGEAIACLHLARTHGMPTAPWAWAAGEELIENVATHWSDPDDGIWEVRGGRRHFTQSKVMAWLAMDRAVGLVSDTDRGRGLASRWAGVRDAIRKDVLERGYDRARGAFTQSYGSPALDASVLTIAHTGFLPADDPRIVSTVRAIERELVRDGYVLRYDTGAGVDGLAGEEGAFLACTFWLADNYTMAGRIGEARELLDRLVGLRNDLGLLAEEVEPRSGRQIGNFPQAFTHLALVASAVRFARSVEGEARKQPRQASVAAPP